MRAQIGIFTSKGSAIGDILYDVGGFLTHCSMSRLILSWYDGEAQLYKHQLALYDAPNWLQDHCINVYLRLLEHEDFPDRDDILFVDPGVVSYLLIQCDEEEFAVVRDSTLRMGRRAVVFIPVNNREAFEGGRSEDSHWSLLVYETQRHRFTHFDPYATTNESAARATAARFGAMLGGKGDIAFERGRCPQQQNGYDCGMYVLAYIKHLAHTFATQGVVDSSSLDGFVSPERVDELRRRIKNRIIEKLDAEGSGIAT